jgi:hypothetical protein
MSLPSEEEMTDLPFMLPQYLRLNEAIEQFTTDAAAHDPVIFRKGRADVRHVVERQLYFALVANKELYEFFVAHEMQAALPDENSLSIWGQQIAPYFRNSWPVFATPNWRSRIQRYFHRLRGEASIRIEGCNDRPPQVLFLVIHPKFVRYLKPIADELGLPHAFLTVDYPEMFSYLAEQDLPRVHLELTAESKAMTGPLVKILGLDFKPGLFDAWIIRLNAVKRGLDRLDPRCVVVPEGNADIYELVNQAAKAAGVSTLCVQQGWAPVVHPGFRNMSYDRMCVWGQRFADLLSPYNPGERFVVTGNHMIVCEPQGNISKRGAVAFFLQNGAHWITERAWRSMLEFIEWASKEFPENEIRVREHPGESLQSADDSRLRVLANVRLMSPATSPLVEVLSECRVAIAMSSTVIFEAVASGVVPLILDVNGFGRFQPDIAGDRAAIEVGSFAAARSELARLMNDDTHYTSFAQPLDDVRKQLFLQDGEKALQAIAEQIRDLGRGAASPQ